ncbi:MAG: cytochrome c3 family protein [Methylotenera sp.]|nr:cytochrome c3 family protein [Methylotenera sp.]
MINCLLIKISYNKRGLPVRSYRTLTAEELIIGRGAECNIHLLDPRIAMHHAVIKRLDDGQIHLVAVNGELEVDGAILQNIALTHGAQVMIGPYQLKVEPAPPDVDLTVSLQLVHRLPDDFQDLKLRTHEPLQGASSFKRRLSLWMAAFIALVFLALPLAQNLIPQLNAAMEKLPLGFDRVWSPGHISNSHLHFGSQCFNCHEVLTRKVSDQACANCHRDTAPHIADPALQKHVFKKTSLLSDGLRCAECHREHKAPHPLARQDNTTCVKCHGNIKASDAKTTLPDIHDFDYDHPDFKLTFSTGHSEKDFERIPQTDTARLVEKSGLKFPHSQHFGKVQGPNGMWDVRELSCTNCHRQEGKEMRFKAVSFKRDCLVCHASQLEVGPADAIVSVPHGAEQNVFNTLKVETPKQFLRYSESLKSNGCAYCHEILETKKGDALPWQTAPLRISQDWFSKAHFNHASHRTQQCQSCHQVEASETSADVAMPDRQSCLQCHSGNNPKHKRIASSCMSCHIFHSANHSADTLPQAVTEGETAGAEE